MFERTSENMRSLSVWRLSRYLPQQYVHNSTTPAAAPSNVSMRDHNAGDAVALASICDKEQLRWH